MSNKIDVSLKDHKINFYLKAEDYDQYGQQCAQIAEQLLADCPSLDSVGFIDVSAGGIQLSGSLKSSPNYYYTSVTISYDWSNLDECVKEFKDRFLNVDDASEQAFKSFTEEGEKYGWD